MTCAEAHAVLHAFVDGELAGVDRDEVERHVGGCAACARLVRLEARFKAAVRAHLSRPRPPSDLRMRIESMLAHEKPPRRRIGLELLPRFLPAVAAVAALLLVMVTVRERSEVLEQAQRSYHRQMPMDVLGPDCGSVASWFQGRVDFPVHPPALRGVTCKGGRLINVRDRPAAYLVYQAPNGHLIKYLVFDARDESLAAPRRRLVQGREVYFDPGPGISTAAYHDRGLAYVATSDLDEDSLVQLVSASFRR